eukprot:scaffold25786_cov81-Phaeocystis_antarctica.AAC.5
MPPGQGCTQHGQAPSSHHGRMEPAVLGGRVRCPPAVRGTTNMLCASGERLGGSVLGASRSADCVKTSIGRAPPSMYVGRCCRGCRERLTGGAKGWRAWLIIWACIAADWAADCEGMLEAGRWRREGTPPVRGRCAEVRSPLASAILCTSAAPVPSRGGLPRSGAHRVGLARCPGQDATSERRPGCSCGSGVKLDGRSVGGLDGDIGVSELSTESGLSRASSGTCRPPPPPKAPTTSGSSGSVCSTARRRSAARGVIPCCSSTCTKWPSRHLPPRSASSGRSSTAHQHSMGSPRHALSHVTISS